MDFVELVMRFEEEFETDIPDQAAALLEKPRDVIDFLIDKPSVSKKWKSREVVAEKIWLIIEDEIGIDASRFDEDSKFFDDMRIDMDW